MTFSGGGTPQQLAAREFFSRPSPLFERQANVGLAGPNGEFKLRPGSSFSQDDLDRFNKRQDEYRRIYAGRFGQDALKDIQRFDRVEDIPVYTEEELRQQKIESLKADPRSAYNYKRAPNPDPPRNQKIPQAVVDSYNALTAKFADPSQRQSINKADFDAVLNALNTAPRETIKPGEVYLGPDFRGLDGKLLRERPDSIFAPLQKGKPFTAEDLAAVSPFTDRNSGETKEMNGMPAAFSETPEIGKAREAGRPRFNADRSVEERKEMREKRRARRAASAKVAARFKERRRAKREAKGLTRKAANF